MSSAAADFRRLWVQAWTPSSAPDCIPLLERYMQPHRHYHNAGHVVECLGHMEHFERSTGDKVTRAARLALFYHDAVYDPRRSDNEAMSAQVSRDELLPLLPAAEVDAIGRLILATDHKKPPAQPDEAMIVDADLAILGQPQAVFDRYETGIRGEYDYVPDDKFRAGRAAVLRHFLARPCIYTTTWFREQYESAARVNLTKSIARLGA